MVYLKALIMRLEGFKGIGHRGSVEPFRVQQGFIMSMSTPDLGWVEDWRAFRFTLSCSGTTR